MNTTAKLFPVENSKAYKIAQMESNTKYFAAVDSAAIIGGSAVICTGAIIVAKGVGFIANRLFPPKAVIPVIKAGKNRKEEDEEA